MRLLRFLPFLLLIPLVSEARTSSFLDTEDHRHQAYIELVHSRGIVQGYEGGEFRPDASINRAEFLKILMLAVFGDEAMIVDDRKCLSDFEGAEQWFWVHACSAKERGIIHGYPDGTFRGEKTVNLAEALKMAIEAWEMRVPSYPGGPPNWFDPYFDVAATKKLFKDLPYEPSHLLTRSEMAALIVLLGQRIQQVSSIENETSEAVSEEVAIVDGWQSSKTCAAYIRYGERWEACTTCGNGICESFEPCTPSVCTSSTCSDDCGELYCPEDCGGRPSFCGNGVVEGKEQCDDGNNEDGDGCSKICILVAEPIRHSTIRVQQLPVGSLNQSLGSDDVTLLAFDVAAGRQDAYMTGVRFKSTAGTLADAQNYRLYADMSGDGKANTLISSVSSQDEILAFTDLHIFVQQGVARRVELKADLTSTASSTSLSVGFDTSDPQYVLAVGAVDGRELTGITTDADECDESMCWIAVYTLDSTGTISIIDRGNLYVTADSVPVKSRQVRAGELSPVLLRIKFRSDGEDIEIRDMAIAGGNDYIDYLDLFEEGSSTQFARARALTCDSPAAGVLCSKPNLIVKSGEEKSILVKAFIRSDSPDEVSGNSFALYLTTGTSPEPAVEARGKSSNETLDQNDGDQNAEGEIFIGTSSVGANATVTGPTHDMVASNIISITNAHDDANGMSVPLGNVVIGAFNFSASEKNSITSNPVHIKNIQFSVNATNVQVDSNSFEVINTNNSDDALTCSASDNTGDITVTCSNIDSSSVASTVNQGSNIMLGLKVNVTDSQVGNGSSTLQVSLRNLGSRSQTGTVEWDDDQTTFDWVDVEDNRVESTRYFNN